ncbi:MAG TPA: hypothetical protein VMQ56_17635 [Terracidiphilus sp.]|jgi:hypothetical protein|nr:hypothetical protein [Terracidiphilus sp.]
MISEIESEIVEPLRSAQTVSGGSYFSSTLIEPRSLFPSAVERVFNLLDDLTNPEHVYMKGEKHPSRETIQWAKKALLGVLPSYYLRTAEIDAFQGEIHVSWERDTKRVVVFVPSKNVLKLYLERTREDGEIRHTLRSIDNPREINTALLWLFS